MGFTECLKINNKSSGYAGGNTAGGGESSMQHMIFDAHLHIIDPAFPLVSNDGFLPCLLYTSDAADE